MTKRVSPVKTFRPRRWARKLDGPLNKRYQEFRFLSNGSQGDLYVARDVCNDGALVAIKFLVQNPSEKLVDFCGVSKESEREGFNALFQWLFEGEVRIHTELAIAGVPNIPGVAEYLGEGGRVPKWDGSQIELKEGFTFSPEIPYFAVECFQGVELARLFDDLEKGRFKLETRMKPEDWGITVAGIMFNLLEALEKIHAHGVIHRDVQPRNIILGFDGMTRLIDFGISILGQEEPSIGGLIEYKAPERLGNEGIYPASDLYSLGRIGYLLLSAYSPNIELRAGETPEQFGYRRSHKLTDPLPWQDSSKPSPRIKTLDDIQQLIHSENKAIGWLFKKWSDVAWEGRATASNAKNAIGILYPNIENRIPFGPFVEILENEYKGRFIIEPGEDLSELDLINLSGVSLKIDPTLIT